MNCYGKTMKARKAPRWGVDNFKWGVRTALQRRSLCGRVKAWKGGEGGHGHVPGKLRPKEGSLGWWKPLGGWRAGGLGEILEEPSSQVPPARMWPWAWREWWEQVVRGYQGRGLFSGPCLRPVESYRDFETQPSFLTEKWSLELVSSLTCYQKPYCWLTESTLGSKSCFWPCGWVAACLLGQTAATLLHATGVYWVPMRVDHACMLLVLLSSSIMWGL